jgi:ABC-2 type transport system permease protein
MSTASAARERRGPLVVGEIAKIPAFLRRDFLTALSYRVYFVSDVLGLLSQALLFYFISKMVDTGELPAYGGSTTTYLEFVVVGVAVGVFVQFALTRVAAALRQEQLQGTLESMLATPTAPGTIQLGSVAFDLVYIPVRTIVFLAVMTVAFGLDFQASGVVPATLVLLAFIPFVWGLGVLSAAVILIVRRGGGVATIAGGLLALLSGAYFPVSLLPSWLQRLADWNPIAITLNGMRSSLLAGADWSATAADLAILLPFSLVTLVIAMAGFRLALRHERVRGTLGVY